MVTCGLEETFASAEVVQVVRAQAMPQLIFARIQQLGLSVTHNALLSATQVLGSSRQPKAEQPSQRPPRKHRQRASQQQAPSQPAHQCPEQLSVERLVRRRPSEGFSCCSEAAASAASAAATAGCGAIASLAVWQGMDVVHMAEWLLQLTPEQRQQVLLMYSEDLD